MSSKFCRDLKIGLRGALRKREDDAVLGRPHRELHEAAAQRGRGARPQQPQRAARQALSI